MVLKDLVGQGFELANLISTNMGRITNQRWGLGLRIYGLRFRI